MNTKRILALVLTLSMVFSLALPGFASATEFDEIIEGQNNTQNNNNYEDRGAISGDTLEAEVRFNLNGAPGEVATQYVAIGGYVAEPEAPTREGYTFDGWYQVFEGMGAAPFDFNTPIADSVELTAFWTNTISEEELQSVLNTQLYSTLLGDPATGDSGEPSGNEEPSGKVAQIGDNQYTTLAEAIEAAQSDATIELIGDIILGENETVTFSDTFNGTLDFNGHTITKNYSDAALVNNGTLTLMDSSNNQTGGVIGIENCVINNGDMTIGGENAFGGNYNMTSAAAASKTISNFGTIRIYSCQLDTYSYGFFNETTGTAYIHGGQYDGHSCDTLNHDTRRYTMTSDGIMTVYDATVTGVHGALAANSGTMTVKGGSFTSSAAGHDHANCKSVFYAAYIAGERGAVTANIEGGTFTSGNSNYVIYIGNDGDGGLKEHANCHITGGYFGGGSQAVNSATMTGSVYIESGFFKVKPNTKYIAEGSTVTETPDSNGYYEVKPTPVAQIGDEEYATLAEAFEAANASTDDKVTITMIGNEIMTAGVTVQAGKNVVLELAGHEISLALTQSGTSALITNKGTLTIQDNTDTDSTGSGLGKISYFNENPDSSSIPGYASNTIINNGTLTVRSGYIENTTTGGYAAYTIDNVTNGNLYTPVLTIEGGKLYNSYTDAVRMFLNSNTNLNTVTISGGIIDSDRTSGRVIVMQDPNAKINKGELNISGGEIKGTINAWSAANAGGVEDCFSDDQYAEIKITISGGRMEELDFTNMANESLRANSLSVTGGYYKESPADYVSIPHKVIGSEDATYIYTIGEAAPVASVNGTNYYTLAEAFAAANEANDSTDETVTIKLLTSVETGAIYTHSNPLILSKDNAVFDLNEQNLTITKNMSVIIRGDNSIVENGTITGVLTGDDWARYGLVIDSCEGVKIQDIVAYTGIAIGGDPEDNYTPDAGAATGVEMIDCTVYAQRRTDKDATRYAVFSQNGSSVTIKSGNYYSVDSDPNKVVLYATKANDGGIGDIIIEGGSFLGTILRQNKAQVVLAGGIFSADPSNNGVFAEGKCVVANTDEETKGTYPYAISNAIIDVNGVGYGTLADAFAAANKEQSGAVITLLADCDTGDATVSAPLALTNTGATLNLNGKTITVNNNFSLVMAADNITVTNGNIFSADNTAKSTGYNSYVLVIGGKAATDTVSGVTVTNVTTHGGVSVGGSSDAAYKGIASGVVLENCNITSGDYYAVASQNTSTVTIKSGIFTANPDSSNSRVLHGYFVGTDGPQGKIFVTGGKFKGAINTTNNGWIYLEGGVYSELPDAGLIAAGYQAKDNTGADKEQYPHAIGEHEHTFTYDNAHAIWHWSVVNGSWTAKVTYKCTKCDNGLETHNASVTGPVAVEGKNRYTATDNDHESVSTYRDFVTTYKITYLGNETTHKYGDAFKAEADIAKDWYVTEEGGTKTLRAKGLATFYLPVTANATVVAEDASTAKQEPTTAGSTSVTISNEKATAVYKVKWSLPDTAQITSEKIYRATSSHGNTKVNQDMVIRLGAQYTVDLNVRNGDFTYTVSNLTPGKDLHLVLEIKYTYTEDGVTKTGTLTDYQVVYLTNS